MAQRYSEVRCTKHRPHMSNGSSVDYCGSLIAGVNENSVTDVIVQCKACKTKWRIVSSGISVVVTEVNEETKFDK